MRIITPFTILVDHGEGTISQCTWTPTGAVGAPTSIAGAFLAVEDYEKIMVMLLTHPKIKDLEFDGQMITAVFLAPEMDEIQRLENPGID